MRKQFAALCIAAGIVLAGSSALAEEAPADNSATNAEDRANGGLTAADQSNAPADVAITTAVRQAVVADSNLSTNAQNVKIITVNGIVTLRGPVKNASEKANIGAKAAKVAGAAKVDNQIEIAGE